MMRFILSIVFGYVLYVPVISMLLDIFICSEQANGFVFFDIDCNTECWDNSHIAYCIMTSVALVQIIPLGIYLRVKFQEIPPDLNILTNPTFIFLKTAIIVCMVLISKLLNHIPYMSTICLSVGMLAIVCLTIIIQPSNYKRIDLYLSTLGSIYVVIIIFCAIPISKIYLIISIVATTFLLLMISLLLQHRFATLFPQMLSFPKSHKIEEMILFQLSRRGQKTDDFAVKIQHRLSKFGEVIHMQEDTLNDITAPMNSMELN